MLQGHNVATLVEQLLQLASRARDIQELTAAFPGPLRAELGELLSHLDARQFLVPLDAGESPSGPDDEDRFYANFGPQALSTNSRLREGSVLVVGQNRISSALAHSLSELGCGKITVVSHAVLDCAPRSRGGDSAHYYGMLPRDAVQYTDQMPGREELAAYSILCAASEVGEVEALLDVNRMALEIRCPYLPIWFADLMAHVGPLNYPFDTPCFACFRLRRDAADPRYPISRQVREQVTVTAAAANAPGLLPPMPRVLGEIAALEVAKAVGGFVPPDATGHVLELNLIAFGARTRRVLKVPRCPECSEVSYRSQKAITCGPHIPLVEQSSAGAE
jgi:bacteriocin biosynthesis cyclodehydratase domain-containing protein